MQRASWRGLLRLSLVSCPIYLSPATTRTKPIRLHQVATSAGRCGRGRFVGSGRRQQGSAGSVSRLLVENGGPDGDQSPTATRITLRPRDPRTGQEIEKCEVVKDTNTAAANSSTLTAEELKAVDVEIYSDYRGTRPERR
jgi:non-homologous end joining protein Ku